MDLLETFWKILSQCPTGRFFHRFPIISALCEYLKVSVAGPQWVTRTFYESWDVSKPSINDCGYNDCYCLYPKIFHKTRKPVLTVCSGVITVSLGPDLCFRKINAPIFRKFLKEVILFLASNANNPKATLLCVLVI